MENSYEVTLAVLQPECDVNERLTLGGILRATQQVGMEQCEAQGVGTAYMLSYHAAWLLAKMSVEVYGDLHDGDVVRAVTEPSAPVHAIYKRITSYYNANDQLVAQVDGRWVLADTDTRRILRRPPAGMQLPYCTVVEKEQSVDIVRAASLEECGSAAALYSRVDLNGHLNNTRYADILCDALPPEVWANDGHAKKAVIYYRNELPMGQTMVLSRGRCSYQGEDAFYITGTNGGTRCFEANILF